MKNYMIPETMNDEQAFYWARKGEKIRQVNWGEREFVMICVSNDWRNGEWINQDGEVIEVYYDLGFHKWEIFDGEVLEERRISKLTAQELLDEQENNQREKVLCPYCDKPVKIDDAVLESNKGKKGLKISHVKCRMKAKQKKENKR